ncbi:MAG: hypothetical protein ACR2OW_12570 [Methyloligellaceae bacterium]
MFGADFYLLTALVFVAANIGNFMPSEARFLRPFISTGAFCMLYLVWDTFLIDFDWSVPSLVN